MSKRDVVVAYIHGGTVTGQFCFSLAETMAHVGQIAGQIEMQSSPRIAEARSQVVEQFAERFPDADWLLMVDADMVWTPSDVELLLDVATRNERPIVGGLCFALDGDGVKPVMFRLLDSSGKAEIIRDYPRGDLVEVDSTGAAFLLVHRQVFAKMRQQFGKRADGSDNPYPWFVEGQVTRDGVALGEDSAFCLRAKAMGIPIHVHTGARIGHVKTRVLTEAMFTP